MMTMMKEMAKTRQSGELALRRQAPYSRLIRFSEAVKLSQES